MGRRRPAEPVDALAYAAFAEELWAACQFCCASGYWRAACLNAIHASIAAADAVCVLQHGEGSSGEAHGEAAELLSVSGAPDARAKAIQLSAIIAMKNKVAYERGPPSRTEGEALVTRAARFVEWAGAFVRQQTRSP